MPCICHGAISSGEFLRSVDQKKLVEINNKLKEDAKLVKELDKDRPEECYKQHHFDQWCGAFNHHLYGCPENEIL